MRIDRNHIVKYAIIHLGITIFESVSGAFVAQASYIHLGGDT